MLLGSIATAAELPYGGQMALRHWTERVVTADRVLLGFAALIVLIAATTSSDQADAASRDLDGYAVVLLVVAGLLLVASGRFPGAAALAVLGVVFVWYGVADYSSWLINIATLVAFFRLGASVGQRRKVVVTGVAVATTVAMMAAVGNEPWRSIASAVGYLVIAVLFGELLRNRRLLIEEYAQRAEHAEADAERRVVEERLRIARDLHDVLAHTISAMTVQAGVAADSLERDPDTSRRALSAIRDSARDATTEVRATVAVLRSARAPALTSPVPRIAQVHEVADSARAQGLDVDVELALTERPVPDIVELTVFRIVQEATTNVLRHARARSLVISVRERPSALEVEVCDDGPDTGEPNAPGLGLRGMAERVESIGGTLRHGRGPDGRWVVQATLPLATGETR